MINIDIDKFNQAILDEIALIVQEQVTRIINDNPELMTELKVHVINRLVNNSTLLNNVDQSVANKIAEKLTAAVEVDSPNTELTIINGQVRIENSLVTPSLTVEDFTQVKDITINGNLNVSGTVDTNTSAWNGLKSDIKVQVTKDVTQNVKQEMVDSVIAQADNLDFTSISLNGEPVLYNDTLGDQIVNSKLRNVGTLTHLDVSGTTNLSSGTLHIENNRVGVNTIMPSSAFDLWDDEVQIVIGKFKNQTGYVGTNRSQNFVLGVNRGEDIVIDQTGTVSIKKFKIGDRSISYGNGVPSYSGITGDIVFNLSFSPENSTFAWFCTGSYSWVPIKVQT